MDPIDGSTGSKKINFFLIIGSWSILDPKDPGSSDGSRIQSGSKTDPGSKMDPEDAGSNWIHRIQFGFLLLETLGYLEFTEKTNKP